MTVMLLKTTPTDSFFKAGPEIQVPMIDKFDRAVTYLCVSVTDRCDFRRSYCMAQNMTFLQKRISCRWRGSIVSVRHSSPKAYESYG